MHIHIMTDVMYFVQLHSLLQPVGHAVAMVLVPAMHSGDARVFLWGRSNVASPLHIFTGHSETVLEVQWRRYKGGKLRIIHVCTCTCTSPSPNISNIVRMALAGCHIAYCTWSYSVIGALVCLGLHQCCATVCY